MKLPRFIHWLYALLRGYFWLPCPICGQYFGGHESTGIGLMEDWNSGVCICPNCESEADKRNSEYMHSHPHPGIMIK